MSCNLMLLDLSRLVVVLRRTKICSTISPPHNQNILHAWMFSVVGKCHVIITHYLLLARGMNQSVTTWKHMLLNRWLNWVWLLMHNRFLLQLHCQAWSDVKCTIPETLNVQLPLTQYTVVPFPIQPDLMPVQARLLSPPVDSSAGQTWPESIYTAMQWFQHQHAAFNLTYFVFVAEASLILSTYQLVFVWM